MAKRGMMDRDEIVKTWHLYEGRGMDALVHFARELEAQEREQIAKAWDGCVHEASGGDVDIGASIRAKRLVDSGSGA